MYFAFYSPLPRWERVGGEGDFSPYRRRASSDRTVKNKLNAVTVTYKISAVDTKARRSTGDITIHNQDGQLVTVGTHILKWVKNK